MTLSQKDLLWGEKYKPLSIKDCILPDRIRKKFNSFTDTVIPSMILYGSNGRGKSVAAQALKRDLDLLLHRVSVSKASENGVGQLETIERFITRKSLLETNSKKKRMVIIDEGDNMSPQFLERMKEFWDKYKNFVTFVITTNHFNKFKTPFTSRFECIDFDPQSPEERSEIGFAIIERLGYIIQQENIQAESAEECQQILIPFVQTLYPDVRKMVEGLSSYCRMNNRTLDKGILNFNNPVTVAEKMIECLESVKTGTNAADAFSQFDQFICDNPVRDVETAIYRLSLIYKESEILKKYPLEIVFRCAEYLKSAQTANTYKDTYLRGLIATLVRDIHHE